MRFFIHRGKLSLRQAIIGGSFGVFVHASVVAGAGGAEPQLTDDQLIDAGLTAPTTVAVASGIGEEMAKSEHVRLAAQGGTDSTPPRRKPESKAGSEDGLAALVEVVRGLGQGYSEPMKPGTWRSLLNGNTLAQVCTSYAKRADFTTSLDNCVMGLHAWTSAAFDREQYIYQRGGGHRAYEGNEIYRFNLATGKWARVTDSGKAVPQDPDGPERQPYKPLYDDGSPSSAHHYAHLIWAKDRLVMGPMLGFGEPSVFNKSIFTWTPDGGYKVIGDAKDWRHSKMAAGCSDIDPATGDVLLSNGGLRRINPATGEITFIGLFHNSKLNASDCVYDPETKTFYDWKDGHLQVLDVKSGESERLTFFEPRKVSVASGHALRGRNVFLWNGGRSVFVWDLTKMPEPAFVELRNAGSTESPEGCGLDSCRDYDHDRGNYGKWWYVESLDVFIGFDEVHEPLWVYRPPETIPQADPRKAELQKQGYTCADTVLGWECPDLQKQVDDGSVQKGLYLQGAVVNDEVDFNGAWIEGAVKNRKGALIAEAGAVIRNVKVTNPSTGGNANCVRLQSNGRVEVHNLTCTGADMGILGNTEELLIANSEIGNTADSGRQLGHILYLCGGAEQDGCTVTIRDSRIYGPGSGGHALKTGASKTVLENVTLDETRGKGSRLIDAVNGGVVEIRNSKLIAAPNDGNGDVIGFDYEARRAHTRNRIQIENSTIDCMNGDLLAGRNSFQTAEIRRAGNRLENCR
ncbi:hypothetical protein CKO28_12960 [Rhodovibrio sodomensis]|uniref:Right handed beta helix domain-containing protein n=1 Tax=Rhodovibrio sodomensis TaxID=1088 RepID=A0ABS1DEP4_9PROT|nr:right-handed parallel beta-helix repeat-containing protein [Rhodovibrio sodomensis]MBK1668941.1 hypothetical protein [Rhodovibrio sodomensis]